MRILHVIAFLSLLFCYANSLANPSDFKERIGTSLNSVTLYPDSSFAKHSTTFYEAGVVFKIIGQSKELHEDADQKQTFWWYEVVGPDSKRGWIFGDGLAVIVPDNLVNTRLRDFHKTTQSFSKGFENANCWVASVEGRDLVHQNAYMNPRYSEEYLVISNEKGNAVHINVFSTSMYGESGINTIHMLDVTDDGVAEIILEKKSKSSGSNLEHNNLEIYSFQAGSIAKVFEERLSLNYNDVLPSPSVSKFAEIDHQTIRMAYIDYVRCEKYDLKKDVDQRGVNKERCLEYVTYSFLWSGNKYKPLYEKSRIVPRANALHSGVRVLKDPSPNSTSIKVLKKGETIEVIKHYEEFVKVGGQKKVENYFLVRTAKGEQGYILSSKIQFKNIEHAKVLSEYYENPPISKSDWKSSEAFLIIKPKAKHQSVSR